ncbi:MAG TPA: c-type cytochrome [Acidobacteriota bacterium]|nr:c-type cytochrome [Acidobacteriota bacterium]
MPLIYGTGLACARLRALLQIDMRLGVILLIFSVVASSSCKRKEYTSGQAVFQGECVKCHMLNGNGGKKGPDLTTIFEKHDERYIRDYTVDPRSIKPDSTMPPAELSEKELSILIQYLKQNARKHASINPNGSTNVK